MPHPYSVDGSPLIPLNYLGTLIAVIALVLALVYIYVHHNHKHFKDRLHKFLLLSSTSVATILVVVGLVLSYILLPAPKVINTSPASGTNNFDPKENIVIEFDRPVSRSKMEKFITPDVPGVWVFESPLYATHLYRKLVFYPDIGLESNANYQIKITNIQNAIQKSKPYELNLSFKTQNLPIIAKALQAVENQTLKLSVPAYLQQHTLSCEVSALRMTLAYKGVVKSEDELLGLVGYDNTPHVGGTWGNPYEHFVGNVNGNQMRDGYGVYWGPIERVAKMFGNALAFEHGDIKLLTDNIKKGNPVIIWTYSKNGTPTSWTTPSGVKVFAAAGEHTVVVVGYVGPADNPTKIIVNDSLVGQVYWPRSLFDRKWATFSQSGVIVYK
ncbi:MAG TPA: C39 family peptidase [Patescibacteria group bacterium]|nr:C39 family peptidase [Patescibacteria group bacterium]